MSKLAVIKKIGIPVPAVIAPDVTHLVAYYGPEGFTPDYASSNRVAVALADVPHAQIGGVDHFVFDPSAHDVQVPGDVAAFAFTLADLSDGEEGDFSPVVSVPLDRDPPVALGQPVLLD